MAHYFSGPAFSALSRATSYSIPPTDASAVLAWSSASENERSRNEPSALRAPHRLPRLEEGSDEQQSNPLTTPFSPSKSVSKVSVRESSSGGNAPMLGRITPFFKSGNKELKAHTLWIQKLSGKRVSVSVDDMTSIMDVERCLWERLGIHPDQQRLTWQEKPVEHSRRIGELGLKQRATLQLTRTLPGAYVLVLSSWGGQIPGHECDLPYLTIGKGSILVAHKLAHADWIFCSDSRGDKGLVPRSHVMVTEIFQKALYDELKHTCSDNSIVPEISQPPDATRKLAAANVTHSNHLLWRRPIGWLKRLFIAKGAVDSPENPMPLSQRRYLHPWDKTLRSTYRRMADDHIASETGPTERTVTLPPLRLDPIMTGGSKSPPVDPGSTLVLRHDMGGIGEASVVLEVSSCHLTSLEDIPTIHAFVRCTPSATERVTFVAVTFNLVDGNKVLDLWPRDASGPVNEVGMTVRDNKVAKGKFKAEVAIDALKIGGEVEQERGKETESSFIMQTQNTVSGLTTGSGVRWVLMEDSVQKRGLPIETPLRMRVRYKPREVRYEYAIIIERNGSTGNQQYKGETTLLFP